MKIHRAIANWLTLLALSTLNSPFSTAFAQGSLTPPGPPGPTMKTLDQIYAQIGTVQDPRTVVNAANTPGDSTDSFIISQPGSYYLTANLVGVSGKNGIEIAANNVTLDLNGFALLGVPGSQFSGILAPAALTNITVRNGTVSGWGWMGVYSTSAASLNLVFERLDVSANIFGINVAGAGVARDCNCQTNQSDGLVCEGGIISRCTAANNGGRGIVVASGTVSGCSAQNNTDGIVASSGSTVSGCFVMGCRYDGIYAVGPGNVVVGNNCVGNNTSGNTFAAGIEIDGFNNRIEDNHVTASGNAGIQVGSTSLYYTNNIIIKNSVSGNGANNYVTPYTQVIGPLITTGGTISSSNPWANFSF